MQKNSIMLTSSGLKNIVLNGNTEINDFCFIFGNQKLIMKNLFAEFISPTVSRLHKTDPTIDFIHYSSLNSDNLNICLEDLFNEETFDLLQKISCGFSVEINEEQSFKLQLISMIICNDELFDLINKIYPFYINELNIDYYLQHLRTIHYFIGNSTKFSYSEIINFIASHFYEIDESKLIKLPKPILHSIISNENFKIESEDSLLDFIHRIFSDNQDKDNDDIDIVEFYEEVQFSCLSNCKFQDFIKFFEFNSMTNKLWSKLCRCFSTNAELMSEERNEKRYLNNYQIFKYGGKSEDCFKGIIYHLTKENGGNVDSKGIVKVTSSSVYNEHVPKIVVDLDDNQHFYESLDKQYSWVKFNFQDKKVRPTHYSLRSRNAGKGSRHLKNWVIEGSNTNNDNDWTILDDRNDITILDGKSATQTFEIQKQLNLNESFRYLRIRQTGVNTSNDHFMTLSALEFFGSIHS